MARKKASSAVAAENGAPALPLEEQITKLIGARSRSASRLTYEEN